MDQSKIQRLEKRVETEVDWNEKERKLLVRIEELEGMNMDLLGQVDKFKSGLDNYKKRHSKHVSILLNDNTIQQNEESPTLHYNINEQAYRKYSHSTTLITQDREHEREKEVERERDTEQKLERVIEREREQEMEWEREKEKEKEKEKE